ncbi:MAG: TetR family transcriptional regulator [Actinobacteria bacterium]|nr:MAG: TetR family transcriptional regulator [Actinomycetota bacterium]
MTKRRRLSEARQTQILQAAVEVIRERGLCETRISDIADRAGTSSALVIYYFQSKDRLLGEALAFSEERFYEETARELQGITSARDQLVRLIQLSCSPGPDARQDWMDEWMLWLDLWARAPRDPDVARDRELLDRRWREAITDIVQAGQQSGEFRQVDAEDFALRLAVTIDGLAIQVVLGDPDVTTDLMEAICLRMAGTELGFDGSSGLASRQQSKGRRVSRSGRASHVAKAAGKSR